MSILLSELLLQYRSLSVGQSISIHNFLHVLFVYDIHRHSVLFLILQEFLFLRPSVSFFFYQHTCLIYMVSFLRLYLYSFKLSCPFYSFFLCISILIVPEGQFKKERYVSDRTHTFFIDICFLIVLLSPLTFLLEQVLMYEINCKCSRPRGPALKGRDM
jgi:hypothetical protein